jgi:hypothetical protein
MVGFISILLLTITVRQSKLARALPDSHRWGRYQCARTEFLGRVFLKCRLAVALDPSSPPPDSAQRPEKRTLSTRR